jgi:hypothetical protein
MYFPALSRRGSQIRPRLLFYKSFPIMRAVYFTYSRINSTKRPASGAVKFIEPRLTSEVGLVRECICAYISVFLQLEWSGCRYSPAYVAAEIM